MFYAGYTTDVSVLSSRVEAWLEVKKKYCGVVDVALLTNKSRRALDMAVYQKNILCQVPSACLTEKIT